MSLVHARMEDWLSIWKSINIIHYIKRLIRKTIWWSLIDEEKAFNTIQYPFMKKKNSKQMELNKTCLT